MIGRAVHIVLQIIIILIIVQALTGMLLSLHYTPDGGAAEVRPGEPATIIHATKVILRDADTLALAGEYALVPADVDDVVPSEAGASVSLTIEHHVPFGSIIRRIHHTNTSLIMIAVVALLALLVVQRAWLTQGVVWSTMIFIALILLGAAFTGRLLPDDIYSNVSALIVRHELPEAPFGSTLTTMLGLRASESARLSTPNAIHTLFMPVLLAVGICVLWRRLGEPLRHSPSRLSVIVCAIAVAFSTVLHVTHYPARDVSNSVHQSVAAQPWWPFAVPNVLVSWLGAELAGYLAIAAFVALVTLPLWTRRTR